MRLVVRMARALASGQSASVMRKLEGSDHELGPGLLGMASGVLQMLVMVG